MMVYTEVGKELNEDGESLVLGILLDPLHTMSCGLYNRRSSIPSVNWANGSIN